MLTPLIPPLHLVLVTPQIPPNTGNVARTCAVTGCRLILVEPLGFSIADKDLKRAGLDYWDEVCLGVLPSYSAYVAAYPKARRWFFTARCERTLYEVKFEPGDHLVFGSETAGLSREILEGGTGAPVGIPMLAERRSMNLSVAAGVAAYEALRQVGAFGLSGS